MIILSRPGGSALALNPDLVEHAEAAPHTVVTLVDGRTFEVAETLDELARRVRDYRASVIAEASAQEHRGTDPRGPSPVIPLPVRE